jgi:hypothetical protein
MSDTYKLSKSNYLKFNNKYIFGGGKSNLDHKDLAHETRNIFTSMHFLKPNKDLNFEMFNPTLKTFTSCFLAQHQN